MHCQWQQQPFFKNLWDVLSDLDEVQYKLYMLWHLKKECCLILFLYTLWYDCYKSNHMVEKNKRIID